jgi:hypothetical protein
MTELFDQIRKHRVNMDGDVCTVMVTTLILEVILHPCWFPFSLPIMSCLFSCSFFPELILCYWASLQKSNPTWIISRNATNNHNWRNLEVICLSYGVQQLNWLQCNSNVNVSSTFRILILHCGWICNVGLAKKVGSQSWPFQDVGRFVAESRVGGFLWVHYECNCSSMKAECIEIVVRLVLLFLGMLFYWVSSCIQKDHDEVIHPTVFVLYKDLVQQLMCNVPPGASGLSLCNSALIFIA